MKRSASLLLALVLTAASAFPAAAAGRPCSEQVVTAVTQFLASGATAVTGGPVIGYYVTVPGVAQPQATAAFLQAIKASGVQVDTIDDAVAWLAHAGFGWESGSGDDFAIYSRDRHWTSDRDGCGPWPPNFPPPAPSGKTGFTPGNDPMSGHGWLPAVLAGLVGAIGLGLLGRPRRTDWRMRRCTTL